MPSRDHPDFEQVARRAVSRARWQLRLAITATAIVALIATALVLYAVPGMTTAPAMGSRMTTPNLARIASPAKACPDACSGICPDHRNRHFTRICS
ncbi:hypothetical protein FXN63_00565 [Pigmentiphaga aceris]|uniref:Uncharacterized protein n=1 Tax=Pigmentiphaga aceris TaxID=1940612 RepID=A0A5C0AQY9_9BURK|nr:hypothetical protein [Pigmentiphaga aceris]QEI04489.1 hypothetical protein FXN63_00565 [Pigmentiphaga aceris]